MVTKTQTAVKRLISKIDTATAEVAAAIAVCHEDQWHIVIGSEGRSIGVVFHHIAYAYPFVVDWALKLAAGDGLPSITYSDVHAINHQHATNHADVKRTATLAILEANSADATTQLGKLTDDDLLVTGKFQLINEQEISVQQVLEWFLINHAYNHLHIIKETLDTDAWESQT